MKRDDIPKLVTQVSEKYDAHIAQKFKAFAAELSDDTIKPCNPQDLLIMFTATSGNEVTAAEIRRIERLAKQESDAGSDMGEIIGGRNSLSF